MAAGFSRQDHVWITTTNWFVCAKINFMKSLVNWIPLRIYVRSRNTQPDHIKQLNNIRDLKCIKLKGIGEYVSL